MQISQVQKLEMEMFNDNYFETKDALYQISDLDVTMMAKIFILIFNDDEIVLSKCTFSKLIFPIKKVAVLGQPFKFSIFN